MNCDNSSDTTDKHIVHLTQCGPGGYMLGLQIRKTGVVGIVEASLVSTVPTIRRWFPILTIRIDKVTGTLKNS